ncbi:MAG: hypothetical protein V4612_02740 [Pseudomonadota bacterium]
MTKEVYEVYERFEADFGLLKSFLNQYISPEVTADYYFVIANCGFVLPGGQIPKSLAKKFTPSQLAYIKLFKPFDPLSIQIDEIEWVKNIFTPEQLYLMNGSKENILMIGLIKVLYSSKDKIEQLKEFGFQSDHLIQIVKNAFNLPDNFDFNNIKVLKELLREETIIKLRYLMRPVFEGGCGFDAKTICDNLSGVSPDLLAPVSGKVVGDKFDQEIITGISRSIDSVIEPFLKITPAKPTKRRLSAQPESTTHNNQFANSLPYDSVKSPGLIPLESLGFVGYGAGFGNPQTTAQAQIPSVRLETEAAEDKTVFAKPKPITRKRSCEEDSILPAAKAHNSQQLMRSTQNQEFAQK